MTNLFFAWPKKPPALLGAKEPKRLLFVLKRKEAKDSSPARSSWRSVVKNDNHLRNSAHGNAAGISWLTSNSPRSVRLSFLRTYRPGHPRGQFQLPSRMCGPDIRSDRLPTARFPDVVKPFGSFSFFCRYKRSFFDSLEVQRIEVGI